MSAGDAPGALALLRPARRVVSKACDLCSDLLECDRRSVAGTFDRSSFELVDMVDIVRECVDDHAGLAQEARCTMRLRLPDRAPSFSHRRSLYRVLANLLRNAAFHGRGRVIEVRVEARAQRNVVIVRDHGAGIPSDVLAQLADHLGSRQDGQDATPSARPGLVDCPPPGSFTGRVGPRRERSRERDRGGLRASGSGTMTPELHPRA